MKRKRTHRLDVLINLLADDVSFDITEEVNRLSANVGRMGSTERRLRANEIKAEEEQRSRHPSSLIHLSDSEYSVVSFNNNAHNAVYIVFSSFLSLVYTGCRLLSLLTAVFCCCQIGWSK